jgi:hypothetical protein
LVALENLSEEASPTVVGNMKFQTRAAAIAACIVEIARGFDRPVVNRNSRPPGREYEVS